MSSMQQMMASMLGIKPEELEQIKIGLNQFFRQNNESAEQISYLTEAVGELHLRVIAMQDYLETEKQELIEQIDLLDKAVEELKRKHGEQTE